SLCGWAVYPLVRRLMDPLPDRGYAFCRCIGWVLAAWFSWVLAWLSGRPLTTPQALGSIGLVAVVCWLPSLARSGRRVHRGSSQGPATGDGPSRTLALLVCTEGLFLSGMGL